MLDPAKQDPYAFRSERWSAELSEAPDLRIDVGGGIDPKGRKSKGTVLTIAILLVLTTLGLAAYRYILLSSVDYYIASPQPFAVSVRGPGVLDAFGVVSISSRIAGRLSGVAVDINQDVSMGDGLVTLEAADLTRQLEAALADARAAERALSEAEIGRDSANAALRNKQGVVERRRSLAKNNFASVADLQAVEADYLQALSEVERWTATIERARSQSLSAAALAGLARARLDEARISSPINGVVISRAHNPGDMVQAGETIMRIVELDSIIVAARFDESEMQWIDRGDIATIRFDSDPGRGFDGTVLRLHRQVDQETREFTADIRLTDLPSNWALGQRGTVDVRVSRSPIVLAVPSDLIARKDGRPGLWMEEHGRALWRQVGIGLMNSSFVQIKSGLQSGDTVLDPRGRFEYERVVLAGRRKT